LESVVTVQSERVPTTSAGFSLLHTPSLFDGYWLVTPHRPCVDLAIMLGRKRAPYSWNGSCAWASSAIVHYYGISTNEDTTYTSLPFPSRLRQVISYVGSCHRASRYQPYSTKDTRRVLVPPADVTFVTRLAETSDIGSYPKSGQTQRDAALSL